MQYILKAPGLINTTIALPASKSISNRALMIQALAGGSIFPTNLSDCDDTRVIIDALRDMPEVIDIKAAGTAMRFMTAYLAVTEGRHVLTGTERMNCASRDGRWRAATWRCRATSARSSSRRC